MKPTRVICTKRELLEALLPYADDCTVVIAEYNNHENGADGRAYFKIRVEDFGSESNDPIPVCALMADEFVSG